MKFLTPTTTTTVLLSLALATTTNANPNAAAASWFSSNSNSGSVGATDDGGVVKGDNPLRYCVDPKDYILDIDYVDLAPNPPVPGHTLNITATGTLSEAVEQGAKVHLEVKYGLIRIINQDVDLCENAKEVNLTCPIAKGEMTLTKSVDIPKEVPPGKYTVLAKVVSKDNEDITCLTASVFMRRGGSAAFVQQNELVEEAGELDL